MGNTERRFTNVILVPIESKTFEFFSRCRITLRLGDTTVVTIIRGTLNSYISLEVVELKQDYYLVRIPGMIMAGFRVMRAPKSFYNTQHIGDLYVKGN